MTRALRLLRTAPGFAVLAILTLALGIGLSTAVFTVADALLLRRLPVRDQDRLVFLWGTLPKRGFEHRPFTYQEARDFARASRTLERVGFVWYQGAWPAAVRDGDDVFRLRRAIVSGEYFDVLGARALLGRALRASDDVLGAPPVAVLSYSAWRQRFGGNPHIVGHRLQAFQTVQYTIVGVMPPGLELPRGTELWAPLLPSLPVQYADLDAVGRLAPGATAASARVELTAFLRRSNAGWRGDVQGVVRSLPEVVLGDTRPALFAFVAAVGLLLLTTCLNVANLLLVRGVGRAREIAIRSAIGADRARIAMQLLGENVVLALAGGVAGGIIGAAAVRIFVAVAPSDLPRLGEIGLDVGALGGAIGITALAMLLFGVAPAITTSRSDAADVLRAGTRQGVARRSRRTTEVLVGVQIALAVLVLSAAALVTRSLVRLERAPLAIEASHLLIGELALHGDEYDTREKALAMMERLLHNVESVPGVRSVSTTVAVPFSGAGGWDGQFVSEGQSARDAASNPVLSMELVTPSYFATVGMPILAGRDFTTADRDNTLPVAIVSRSAARAYWPNENPLGKHLRLDGESKRVLTVIGVVPDARYRDLRDARPSIYFPLAQPSFDFIGTTLVIRTIGAPESVVPAVRRAVAATSSGVALTTAEPFAWYLDGPLAQPRLDALLLAVFAGAVVILASIGLFGVMMTMVRQRTRELGVRIALGADQLDVQGLVVRRGLTIAAIGVVVGLAGALAVNRLLSTLLFEVSPTDPATLAVVALLLLVVAALASLVPARATTRIDPAIALRADG